MFDEIIKMIQAERYSEAVAALTPLTAKGEPKDITYANYLLGFIYTRYDNPDHDDQKAKRYLQRNLKSSYPHPHAYYLFARVEEDKNVALNYLNIGVSKHPNNPFILKELLRLSPDKEYALMLINDSKPTDVSLLSRVISHFIETHQWGRIQPYLEILRVRNDLDNKEILFLDFLQGYSFLFREDPDYFEAERAFLSAIDQDTDNYLAYAHYLGLIYAYVRQGKKEEAVSFFDRLPVNNSIHDFFDGPQPFDILALLEQEYACIFDSIIHLLSKDSNRKLKAEVLYALYLYNPSEDYGMFRYRKADAAILSRYLKRGFNSDVANALYYMRNHFSQFKEAYKVLCDFIKHYEQWEDELYPLPFECAKKEELLDIANYTVECLQDDDFDRERFVDALFSELVEKLYQCKMFETIRVISDNIPDSMIMRSDCKFECAFAYGEIYHERACHLYGEMIRNDSNNTSALNNLGVQCEHEGLIYEALDLYEKAHLLKPTDELIYRNLERVRRSIWEKIDTEMCNIADSISMNALEEIGCDYRFYQKIHSVKDEELQRILYRDFKECAVAVVAGQDKMATIMCGSIMEALLMQKIRERNIEKYDISPISKGKHATNYPVLDMGLNELLFVADKEQILDKTSYHLGHYIREYRNVVHPAKEKRLSEEVNHENVMTMWAVLKRLLNELY